MTNAEWREAAIILLREFIQRCPCTTVVHCEKCYRCALCKEALNLMDTKV